MVSRFRMLRYRLSRDFLMAKKSKRTQRVLAQIKAQRGLDRKQYFEEGGEMIRWRGLHLVQRDKTKYTRKSKHKGQSV